MAKNKPQPAQAELAQTVADDDARVAVYVCHCGGNISDVIDVRTVANAAAQHPQVALAREFTFMCSDPGQAMIIEDIKEKGINRVVVCACSPTLHELTFRSALERAGLNPYLFEHINIREQDSWVHKGDHDGATRKAIRLTTAGVAKVALQDPLVPIRVDVTRHVLVVGGGVAGLRAALSVARNGLGVTLIDKSAELGGHLRELGRVFPTEEQASDLLAELLAEVAAEPRIELLPQTEVTSIDGHVGKFTVTVRGTDGEQRSVPAGAIVLATGFEHYRPAEGEYGYGQSPAVLTLPEFNQLLDRQHQGLDYVRVDGRDYRRVAFIHCVGSRQVEGVHQPGADGKLHDYCSRTCCTATLHAANRLLERFPRTQVLDLNKDIRTYGRGHEAYYEEASRRGVVFFRYPDEEPPSFDASSRTLTFRDRLTWGEELSAEVDLVVLATGMRPRDIADLIDMRKLPTGADDFLQEVHPKLRPVEMAVAGVLLAGSCQGPMDIGEACAAGETAGAKAAILLSRPTIELDPFVARVDESRCDGCELCLAECEYKGALLMADREVDGQTVRRAEVTPALCAGCGACVAVCPTRALSVAGWSLEQFDAMVDAIAADPLQAAEAGVEVGAVELADEPEAKRSSADASAMVKAARAARGPLTPAEVQSAKDQKQIQSTILAAIADEPRTVPQIAEATGLDEQTVLWWVTALRKYDRVQDEGKRSGYMAYRKK